MTPAPRLLCSLALLTLAPALVAAAPAEAAAMFRGDPAHTGVYPSPASGNLDVRWTFQTGEAVVSSPVVAGGTVYVGSADNFLYALDAASGKPRWKFDAHGDVRSSPAVGGDLVYVVSLDGRLYAVDAATGAQRWSFATRGERRHTAAGMDYSAPATEVMPDPWDLFLSSPTVADGVVYFGSGDGRVYAVDATTGALRWEFQTGNVVHASPAVAGGRVYVGGFDAYFYALEAATGRLVWKFRTGEDAQGHLMTGIPGSAAVADGIVYFGSRDAHVYALEAETGRQLWQYSAGNSWVIASPAVHDGRVCFTTSDSLRFVELDARTGAEVFSLPNGTYSFSSPAVAGGRAYYGTFGGKLHAVDLAARKPAGEFATPGFRLNGPRYLDADGKLNAAAVWTGDTLDDAIVGLRARLFSLGSILSSPAIHDGVVYVCGADGVVYALGR